MKNKKKGKKGYKDRHFSFTSSEAIDLSLDSFKMLKLYRIPEFKDIKAKDVVLQKCHVCTILPRWYDEEWDPKKPNIRRLLFRVQMCPGNCKPCWGQYPPDYLNCVNNDTCGEWLIVVVDLR